MLGSLGEAGTSNGYRETATAEKTEADKWRRWTVSGAIVSGLTIIGIVIWSLADSRADEGLVTRLLTRSTLSVPLIALVIYLGRQASEHRQQERKARSLGLQLGSVSTFVADLSDEKRADLKQLLSERLYVGESAGSNKRASERDAAGYPNPKELFEFVFNLAKRG